MPAAMSERMQRAATIAKRPCKDAWHDDTTQPWDPLSVDDFFNPARMTALVILQINFSDKSGAAELADSSAVIQEEGQPVASTSASPCNDASEPLCEASCEARYSVGEMPVRLRNNRAK